MIILGIETSCDETAAAVVEGNSRDEPVKILSNVVASSEEFHKKTGGIVPEAAARKQIELIIPVLSEAAAQSKVSLNSINAIAVTVGPGLVGSLLIGVETARALALVWKKPLFPVNHLVAHLYASWIKKETSNSFSSTARGKRRKRQERVPQFPALGVIVSGGHTNLVMFKNHKEIEYLGGTRDDAAGEAFDKISRMLGLGYPGGPAIESEALSFAEKMLKAKDLEKKVNNITLLPRPMINSESFDFSFSGLKTAVKRILLQDSQQYCGFNKALLISWLAYETQQAICEVIVAKTTKAVSKYSPSSVILAGGVAANLKLRKMVNKICEQNRVACFIPPIWLCTDNAAAVAACSLYLNTTARWQDVTVNPSLEIMDLL